MAYQRDLTPLLWSAYFDAFHDVVMTNGDSFRVYTAGNKGPNVVFLHGGGHSALTWSLTARILKQHCMVYAVDFRGHGESITCNDADLSAETLVNDSIQVIKKILPEENNMNPQHSTILVGHSMGGTIAVRIAAAKQLQTLAGVMIIDVVEGTALAALNHMTAVLDSRPKSFDSFEESISWSLRSGVVKNIESARVSIPSQLKKCSDGSLVWRTDLYSSSKYWKGWFLGLSEMFLEIPIHSVLLLAGTDRLDTALTRGQMQGKFQLLLMYGCGHIIQEDSPDKTADAILNLCGRVCVIPGVKSERDILAERLAKAKSMIPGK